MKKVCVDNDKNDSSFMRKLQLQVESAELGVFCGLRAMCDLAMYYVCIVLCTVYQYTVHGTLTMKLVYHVDHGYQDYCN